MMSNVKEDQRKERRGGGGREKNKEKTPSYFTYTHTHTHTHTRARARTAGMYNTRLLPRACGVPVLLEEDKQLQTVKVCGRRQLR